MPKLYDMWTELKFWLEIEEAKRNSIFATIVLEKMKQLESEHE